MHTESAVRERYAAGAHSQEAALCCPVDYQKQHLEIIPAEVIEKDYGCGNPSKYLQPGETVLDLGSGTGKICFIASQVVGAKGKVIGIDMTDDMLEVARRNAPIVAERSGFGNVEFHKGRIQDLALDLEALDRALADRPLSGAEGFLAAEEQAAELRAKEPMIADGSVDVVVSNCVLNLVDNKLKDQLFEELFRVIRPGGRAVISDIVSDEPIPVEMQNDPLLWSGCISGAYLEQEFLAAFEKAGFIGVRILELGDHPWQTVGGIEFRSTTIEATKPELDRPCLEAGQAVIYRGPFKKVLDDDGHAMERGRRYALCDRTADLYRSPAYAGQFEIIEPREPIAAGDRQPFDCKQTRRRHPKETKGKDYDATSTASDCCSPEGSIEGCC